MTVKQVMVAALAATALGMVAGVAPASAQYGYGGGGYGGGYGGRDYDRGDDYRPRRFERPDYDDDRPRFRRRGGSICVTARGNCAYPPAPRNAPCRCDIPGFGEKRGAIGGY